MTKQPFDLDPATGTKLALTSGQAPEGQGADPSGVAVKARHPAVETAASVRTVRDDEIWSLANRIEQLHRSAAALRGLVQRSSAKIAGHVTVTPRAEQRPKSETPRGVAAKDSPWWPTAGLPDTPMQPPPGL